MKKATTHLISIRIIKVSVNIFFIVGISFTFSCCESEVERKEITTDPLERNLKEFSMVFPIIATADWEIVSGYENEDEVVLSIQKAVEDTTVYIALEKYYVDNDRYRSSCYSIKQYIKTFSIGDRNFNLFLKDNLDTLYFFYYEGSKTDLNQEIFIKGKYRYQFDFDMLNLGQRKFYLENRDSLDKIGGQNIPPLPDH